MKYPLHGKVNGFNFIMEQFWWSELLLKSDVRPNVPKLMLIHYNTYPLHLCCLVPLFGCLSLSRHHSFQNGPRTNYHFPVGETGLSNITTVVVTNVQPASSAAELLYFIWIIFHCNCILADTLFLLCRRHGFPVEQNIMSRCCEQQLICTCSSFYPVDV